MDLVILKVVVCVIAMILDLWVGLGLVCIGMTLNELVFLAKFFSLGWVLAVCGFCWFDFVFWFFRLGFD